MYGNVREIVIFLVTIFVIGFSICKGGLIFNFSLNREYIWCFYECLLYAISSFLGKFYLKIVFCSEIHWLKS